MKELDYLLENAFPEELEKAGKAPVSRRAVREKTFQKLGLEPSPKRVPFQGEWALAEAVVKRRHPWAVLVACLVVAVLVGTGIFALPLLTTPSQSAPLTPGTYLELEVLDAAFDEESWAMVFTLEARTDFSLADPNSGTQYTWDFTASLGTEVSHTSFSSGESPQWERVGENTYRCQGYAVEVIREAQEANNLYGTFEGTIAATLGGGERNLAGVPEQRVSAETTFAIDLPGGEGSTGTSAVSAGTYFEISALDANFDEAQQAIVLTLEARTDATLDNPSIQAMYTWFYTLWLGTENGDLEAGNATGDSLETFAQWAKTGENVYQSGPVTIPLSPSLIEEHQQELTGKISGALYLTLTKFSLNSDTTQFFPAVEFTVTLPAPTRVGIIGSEDGPTQTYVAP